MSRRRISAVLAGAVALGTLSAVPFAGAASAEPTFVPQAADIVGVGSDTTQFAMNFLADGATVGGAAVAGYNAGRSSARLVSFDAAGTGLTPTVVLKQGDAAITRPNGSGAGKALLFNPSNPSVNFARSSSSLSTAEIGGGLFQVPFAVDGLKLAVRAAGSNAPAKITPTDLVHIYDGSITNWSAIGGTAGVIKPLIPQAGSGTRSFFLAQLQAANGGVAVVLGGDVVETQEHSDVDIKDDANALAPFSTGRAKTTPTVALLGGTAVGGFEAKRALYNVFRQADLGASWWAPVFGPSGFVCSTAARPLIENAGFDQLAAAAAGGACGEATQAATTNFTTNTAVAAQQTTTTLTTSASAQKVTLTAKVTAPAGTPVGSVKLLEGATQVGTANLSGGVAIVLLSGVAAGSHTYTASYAPGSAGFLASQSAPSTVTVTVPAPVVVKKASKTTVTMPLRFAKTVRVKAKIKVTVGTVAARGKVAVLMGTKRLATGTLSHGKVTIKLPKLKKGKHKLVFRYLGNTTTKVSQAVKKVVVTS